MSGFSKVGNSKWYRFLPSLLFLKKSSSFSSMMSLMFGATHNGWVPDKSGSFFVELIQQRTGSTYGRTMEILESPRSVFWPTELPQP